MRAKRKKKCQGEKTGRRACSKLSWNCAVPTWGKWWEKKMSEKVRKINRDKGGKDQERLGT